MLNDVDEWFDAPINFALEGTHKNRKITMSWSKHTSRALSCARHQPFLFDRSVGRSVLVGSRGRAQHTFCPQKQAVITVMSNVAN